MEATPSKTELLKMKIGIINMQYSRHNYGALLQAAALQSAIQSLQADSHVEHIEIRAPWQSPRNEKRSVSKVERLKNLLKNLLTGWPAIPRDGNFEVFLDFRNQYIKRTSKAYVSDEDYASENWDYDVVVVGSDQVFRAHYVAKDWDIYFLAFLPESCRRVAYSASFGVDHWEAEDDATLTANVREALSLFSAVSVREQSGVSICREKFGVVAEHVLDPTLLVGRGYFDEMIETEASNTAMPDWAVHLISNDADNVSAISKLSCKYSKVSKNIYYDRHGRWPLRPIATFSSVPRWLNFIRGARELVLTDSYHCVCFCILFRKEFLVFLSKEKGTGRMYSLLKLLGLEDRICSEHGILEEAAKGKRPIDYAFVERILEDERAKAWAFLRQSIG